MEEKEEELKPREGKHYSVKRQPHPRLEDIGDLDFIIDMDKLNHVLEVWVQFVEGLHKRASGTDRDRERIAAYLTIAYCCGAGVKGVTCPKCQEMVKFLGPGGKCPKCGAIIATGEDEED